MRLTLFPRSTSPGRIAARPFLILILLPIPILALTLDIPPRANATDVEAVPRLPFDEAVANIFRVRCVRCHGPDEVSGGLRLDSYDAIMRGGELGPVVVPRDARASLLMRKVLRRDKPAMPPREPLPTSEIRRIRSWIESGASP